MCVSRYLFSMLYILVIQTSEGGRLCCSHILALVSSYQERLRVPVSHVLSILVIVCVFDYSRLSGCEVVSHLWFPS